MPRKNRRDCRTGPRKKNAAVLKVDAMKIGIRKNAKLERSGVLKAEEAVDETDPRAVSAVDAIRADVLESLRQKCDEVKTGREHGL